LAKQNRNSNKILNPGAAVIVYNYKYRMGVSGVSLKEAHEVEEKVITHTSSLISISTSKGKARPEGSFEFRLAPNKNWVNAITPGSWCVILISNDGIQEKDLRTANYNKVKMLGRIESVRLAATVDASDGKIMSEYVVQGTDWAGILNTNLYVDPIIYEAKDKRDPFGAANRFFYNGEIASWNAGENGFLPSSSDNIKTLLAFWGATNDLRSKIKKTLDRHGADGRLSESLNRFKLPDKLVDYFSFWNDKDEKDGHVANIIDVVHGKLIRKDKKPEESNADESFQEWDGNTRISDLPSTFFSSYQEVDDGVSPLLLDIILGNNNFWQLIINCSNPWLNDTYVEMRWDRSDKKSAKKSCYKDVFANLVVYNRIKPFAVNSMEEIISGTNEELDQIEAEVAYNAGKENEGTRNKQSIANAKTARKKKERELIKDLPEVYSPFKNVRVYEIDRSDVLSINAGTNWRDRYNFIEVNVDTSVLGTRGNDDIYSRTQKLFNQTYDEASIGRDGFKPLFIKARYIPKNIGKNGLDPLRLGNYKLMNREWYFNTHRMLNGSIVLTGQSKYVAVGDNVLIDASALFSGKNTNVDHIANPDNAYILAHIETVNHSATVGPGGNRNFVTEITFIRGIITDSNGNQIKVDDHIDFNVSKVSKSRQENSNRVFTTSSGQKGKADPNKKKNSGT
jgi:hypothetical protein